MEDFQGHKVHRARARAIATGWREVRLFFGTNMFAELKYVDSCKVRV